MSPRIGHSRAGGTFGSGQALDSRLRGNDIGGKLYFYGLQGPPRPSAALSGPQRSTSSTLTTAMNAKPIRSGTIAVLSARLNARAPELDDAVSTSFWIKRVSNSTMTISPNDAASVTVVTVETVVVVTVVIKASSSS